MTSSPPIGLEGSDLSSVNTMMSAVMSVGKVAENGGSPQSAKSPTKPPGPNRIGRRNQVSFCALAVTSGGFSLWGLWEKDVRSSPSFLSWNLGRVQNLAHTERLRKGIFQGACQFPHGENFLCSGVNIGGSILYSLSCNLIWLQTFFTCWPRQRTWRTPPRFHGSFLSLCRWLIGFSKPPSWFILLLLFLTVFTLGSK